MCYPGALQGQPAPAGLTQVRSVMPPPPAMPGSLARDYVYDPTPRPKPVPMPNAYQAPANAYDPAAMPFYQSRMPGDVPDAGEYDPNNPPTYRDAPEYGSYDTRLGAYDTYPNAGPQVKDDILRPYFYRGSRQSPGPGPERTMPVNQDWKT